MVENKFTTFEHTVVPIINCIARLLLLLDIITTKYSENNNYIKGAVLNNKL